MIIQLLFMCLVISTVVILTSEFKWKTPLSLKIYDMLALPSFKKKPFTFKPRLHFTSFIWANTWIQDSVPQHWRHTNTNNVMLNIFKQVKAFTCLNSIANPLRMTYWNLLMFLRRYNMNTQFRLGRIHTAILVKLHSMLEHGYAIWIVNGYR